MVHHLFSTEFEFAYRVVILLRLVRLTNFMKSVCRFQFEILWNEPYIVFGCRVPRRFCLKMCFMRDAQDILENHYAFDILNQFLNNVAKIHLNNEHYHLNFYFLNFLHLSILNHPDFIFLILFYSNHSSKEDCIFLKLILCIIVCVNQPLENQEILYR